MIFGALQKAMFKYLFDDDEEDYEGGELREHGGVVYQCAASPQNSFCSMDGKFCCVLYLI